MPRDGACGATPMRPKGSGGAWASAALELLDDATASPASRCLASARAALGMRHILILGQDPRIRYGEFRAPSGWMHSNAIEWPL
jgi:hypothetical protein